MSKNARPRHAAPSRTTRLMGRAALGVLGAPVAMLAVAGPAGAAELDMGGRFTDGDTSGTAGMTLDTGNGMPGADEFALPGGDGLDTDALAADDLDFQGIDPSVLDFGGFPEAPAPPAVPALPEGGSLPGADDLNTDALPGAEDLDSDALPGAGGFDAPALPGAEDVDPDALPSADTAPTAVALPAPAGLPSADCDDDDEDAPGATATAGDRFSAEDLVGSLI